MTTEVLDAVKPPATPMLPSAPNMTVIDAATGTITYEYKAPSLMLAEANSQLEEAKALVPCIDSDVMYQEAVTLLQKIVGDWKSLDEARLVTTKPLRDQTDKINADFKPAIDVRKQAETLLKTGVAAYEDAKERERRRLQALADEQARQVRLKAEAEARELQRKADEEAARVRREAREQAEAEQRRADEAAQATRDAAARAAKAGDAETAEKLNQQAEQIVDTASAVAQTTLTFAESEAALTLDAGQQDAEALRQAAQMTTGATVAIAKPRATGASSSIKYSAEVEDPKAFVQFVLDNWDTMNHLLTIEQGKLNGMAQNQKERFKVAGCVLHTNRQMAVRRR